MAELKYIVCVWTGDAFIPHRQQLAACHQQFGEGEIITLAIAEERSQETHNHYFACIKAAHDNLPDTLRPRYPTTAHLRAHALIMCRYADVDVRIYANEREARRALAMERKRNEYAICLIDKNTVTVLTAKSQSRVAMGAQVFQESKQAVIEYLSDLIGVSVTELLANAGAAA